VVHSSLNQFIQKQSSFQFLSEDSQGKFLLAQ